MDLCDDPDVNIEVSILLSESSDSDVVPLTFLALHPQSLFLSIAKKRPGDDRMGKRWGKTWLPCPYVWKLGLPDETRQEKWQE